MLPAPAVPHVLGCTKTAVLCLAAGTRAKGWDKAGLSRWKFPKFYHLPDTFFIPSCLGPLYIRAQFLGPIQSHKYRPMGVPSWSNWAVTWAKRLPVPIFPYPTWHPTWRDFGWKELGRWQKLAWARVGDPIHQLGPNCALASQPLDSINQDRICQN